jgi:serine/threonine protein kinase
MDSTKEYLGPEIGPKEIEKKEQIGLGSYGIVYKGKCRGKDVAIKVPHKPIKDPKILEKFKEEAKIMRYFIFNNNYTSDSDIFNSIRAFDNQNLFSIYSQLNLNPVLSLKRLN